MHPHQAVFISARTHCDGTLWPHSPGLQTIFVLQVDHLVQVDYSLLWAQLSMSALLTVVPTVL